MFYVLPLLRRTFRSKVFGFHDEGNTWISLRGLSFFSNLQWTYVSRMRSNVFLAEIIYNAHVLGTETADIYEQTFKKFKTIALRADCKSSRQGSQLSRKPARLNVSFDRQLINHPRRLSAQISENVRQL